MSPAADSGGGSSCFSRAGQVEHLNHRRTGRGRGWRRGQDGGGFGRRAKSAQPEKGAGIVGPLVDGSNELPSGSGSGQLLSIERGLIEARRTNSPGETRPPKEGGFR